MEQVSQGPIAVSSLLETSAKQGYQATRQGVYGAIKKLRERDMVILQKGVVSLNMNWVQQCLVQMSNITSSYAQGLHHDRPSIPVLGKKMQYSCSSLHELMTLSTHMLIVLDHKIKPQHPMCWITTHAWMCLVHMEQLDALFHSMRSSGRQWFLRNSGKTSVDKFIFSFPELLEFPARQYYMTGESLFKKDHYYAFVIGDVVIDLWLGQEIVEEIEEIYSMRAIRDVEDARAALLPLLHAQSKHRLVIHHDPEKAERYKRRAIRGFHCTE